MSDYEPADWEEKGRKALELVTEMEHWLSTKAPYQAPEVLFPNLNDYHKRMKDLLND